MSIKKIKDKEKVDLSKKLKQNPWILSTLVFGIIAIILLASSFNMTGQISKDVAGNNFVDFINSRGGIDLEYLSSETYGGSLYEITVLSDGKEMPVYITQDGKYFVQILSPIVEVNNTNTNTNTNTQTEPEITKANVPAAELFVWSYCPYGVTALSPFAEVAKLFGDKIDFKVVLYHDGHGDYEAQQNMIQECIQKYEGDKYWDYAIGFSEDIYPECGTTRDIECDLSKSIELMDSLNMDSDKILSCLSSEGSQLIQSASNRARELGITGSPSFVLNDVFLRNVARNAEAYKDATCQSFNDVPEECGQSLSTESASTSGNC